ncbi:MAG: ORF1b [Tasmanian devil-associated astrovirus 1]|nr:MAG: ORF1b [Tasmanian devil-associated astrovirus 1]
MQDLEPPIERFLVPPDHILIGHIDIDRPVCDKKSVTDPLVGLIPQAWNTDYGASIWGPEAYIKSFEKFHYSDPELNISKKYKQHWDFAYRKTMEQYDFLKGTRITPILSTEKNEESTPAYPLSCFYKTERDYLENHGWVEYHEAIDDVLQHGSKIRPLWYLFLKKEILKKEKIASGDIRQILCADPRFSRIGAMFEENQNKRMKARTYTKFGQCGWNPFAGGFQQRMRRLLSKGNSCYVEFDWTRFDGTIPREVFMLAKKIRWTLLHPNDKTKDNYKIYKWYCEALLDRCVLLPSGEVTHQSKGNPSGQISTTMDNNICNTFLQAFEFSYICGDAADELWDKFDTIVYGDDRLSTYPFDYTKYVTTVIDMYKNVFGMWVKPDKVKVSHSLSGLSFCGFVCLDDLSPYPSNPDKFIASLTDPVKKLSDLDSLYTKILCFRLLVHNSKVQDKYKDFFDECLFILQLHYRSQGVEPPVLFDDSDYDYIWRGGPK